MSVDWETLIPLIAHDTRALVRKGLSNAQLLERVLGPAIGPDASDHLRAVIESQMDLNRLFVRLVALADAERPRRASSAPAETLDLETVILGAKLENREAIERTGAELVIQEVPALNVPQKTQVVLRELIENSLLYRDVARNPRVDISAEIADSKLRVRVADNGSGVESAYADKLFQPLQRLDAKRSGFGLGLAISRAIIVASGGTIYFEPSGAGANFVFELPA